MKWFDNDYERFELQWKLELKIKRYLLYCIYFVQCLKKTAEKVG